ncbi:MAG: hypothetical protein JST80_07415 [Bdellovibrionales bacterium]|nr:hypothetical protein [Bdellovibrionales bacterium]
MDVFLAAFGLFPISFFAFVASERVNVIHQARVGRGIVFGDYLSQQWIDMIADLKSISSWRAVFLYLCQLSCAALLFLNVDCAFYLYLLFNWFLIVISTHDQLEVFERVSSDRSQMRFLIGAFISFICVLACGVGQGSLNISEWSWNWTNLLFVFPFQIAGMILFGEHPFAPMYPRIFWLKSSRFFVWSLLATKIFMGGSWFVVDFYLKTVAVYLVSRLMGQYFPKYSQADLFRISIQYLIPITFFLFLISAVTHV